jgi:hypothetical protein
MPRHAIARAAEGTAEPASTTLSPVARDYPSPRFQRVFHAAVRLAVLSRNEDESAKWPRESHAFVLHKLFTISRL